MQVIDDNNVFVLGTIFFFAADGPCHVSISFFQIKTDVTSYVWLFGDQITKMMDFQIAASETNCQTFDF